MLTAYAEGAANSAAAAGEIPAGGGIGGMVIYLAVMVGIFYFLLIRPQKKRQRAMANMLDSLMINDEVVTAGGIMGKVVTIKEDSVVIESSADRTKIKLEKNSISRVLTIHE